MYILPGLKTNLPRSTRRKDNNSKGYLCELSTRYGGYFFQDGIHVTNS